MVTNPVYRQIRIFVAAWLAITFAIAMATFLAIYFSYTPFDLALSSENPLPLGAADADEATDNRPRDDALAAFEPAAPAPESIPAIPLSPALPTNAMRFAVGIQVENAPDPAADEQIDWYRYVAEDLKLPWVKQQLRWDLLEPQPGQIDWSQIDYMLNSAQEFSFRMMLSIVGAPAWAREAGADLLRNGPPADPQTFANFVAEIVKRYPGRVQAIEVWNEQNIGREWTSIHGLNAAHYVSLLRATYQTVKALDPDIIIISGALLPTGVNDGAGAYDDFVYFRQMIDNGMLHWADCVGAQHNGYNISPDFRYDAIPDDPAASYRGPFDNPHHSWSFRSTLEGYIDRIRAAGHDSKLCVTEFGWPSAEDLPAVRRGFEFASDNSLAEQAAWIGKALSNMEEWDFVWLAFIWNLNHGPLANYAADNDNVPYSLIGPAFSFRPAYAAIREWQQEYRQRQGSS